MMNFYIFNGEINLNEKSVHSSKMTIKSWNEIHINKIKIETNFKPVVYIMS